MQLCAVEKNRFSPGLRTNHLFQVYKCFEICVWMVFQAIARQCCCVLRTTVCFTPATRRTSRCMTDPRNLYPSLYCHGVHHLTAAVCREQQHTISILKHAVFASLVGRSCARIAKKEIQDISSFNSWGGVSGCGLHKGDPFLYISSTPERRQKLQNASSNCLWVLERTHCALGGRPLRRSAITSSSSRQAHPVSHSSHPPQLPNNHSDGDAGASDDANTDFEVGRRRNCSSGGDQDGGRSSRIESGSSRRRSSALSGGKW